MNIVCYCAHGDDMVLGAGGYMAKLTSDSGNRVTAVFATDGLLHPPKYIDTRDSSVEACRTLGIEEVFFLNIPNQRFDSFPLIDINKRYEALGLEPDLLITNSKGQLNKDHRIIHESARVVTRPLTRRVNMLSFESTVWRLDSFTPSLYVDIADTLDRKIEAMKAFKTEIRPYPHSRSVEALEITARYWGLQSGYEYAEAFEVIRWFG